MEMNNRTLPHQLADTFRRLAELPNMHMNEGWAKCFNSSKSASGVYTGLAYVTNSLDRLEAEVRASGLKDHNKQFYLEAIGWLRIYCATDGLQSVTTGQLKANHSEAINRLQLLDDVLPVLEDRSVDVEHLTELRNQIASALGAARGSDINASLLAVVEYHLTQVLWAIDNFNVIGLEGLASAYGASVAGLARASQMKGADVPAARTWFKKIGIPLAGLASALALAGEGVEGADKVLTHSIHMIEVIQGDTDAPSEDKPARAKKAG